MIKRSIFIIIMFVIGSIITEPQAHASKFRGIVGIKAESTDCLSAGMCASFGLQTSKNLYIGAGVHIDTADTDDANLTIYANPRFDLFSVSCVWTPYASGRIEYLTFENGSVYYGIDLGIRRALRGSKGISLSIGFESCSY